MSKGPGTGEFRSVINLKELNRFLPNEKFKMEELNSARSFVRRVDYIMKLDLKNAYHAVLIYPDSKYLLFQFKGKTYEFRYDPLGLSLAPRVFTRIICMRLFVAKLRSEEIRTVIYLDDLLLIYHQKVTLREIFLYMPRILSSLGFGTNSSLSLPGCGIRRNLQVSCPVRGTDQSDTGNMPGNAQGLSQHPWAHC